MKTIKLFRSSCLLIIGFFLNSEVFTQEQYSGRISGPGNVALSGATITVKGKPVPVTADKEGQFTLSAKEGDVVRISVVGYVPVEFKLGNNLSIHLELAPQTINMEEVLVTGYTSQRLKDIAGSVAAVKVRDLVSIPAGTADNMFQGRVAGLTVISSGEPGAPANIRLHGIGNFGDVTPMCIIDGVQGNLNSINPNDIETAQVLKDAAAYSIYGVRGANGVIIITTRKGKQGRVKVGYEMYLGYQLPLKQQTLLNPQQNADLFWKAKRNSKDLVNGNPNDVYYGNGSNPVLPDYLFAGQHVQTLFDGDPRVADSLYNLDPDSGPIYQIVRFNKTGTDWYGELFKPAFSQNHVLTVSGGGDRNQYLVSMGYLDQEGTLINTFLKRFTIRANTSFQAGKYLQFGENIQLSYSKNPKPFRFNPGINNLDDFYQSQTLPPAQPVYDTHGAWNPLSNSTAAVSADNPVARRNLAKDYTTGSWQVLGNVYGSLNFLKYFNLRSSFGGSLNSYYNKEFFPSSYDNTSWTNRLLETSGYFASYTWTNTLSFDRQFEQHSLKLLIGTEFLHNQNQELGASVRDLAYSDPDYWLLSNGKPGTERNYSLQGESNIASIFGRLEYNFEEKYFLTATVRRDGASVFGPQNRFGWFPAFGVAWRVKEEKFMEKLTWIDELKLRASWGKTGFYGNTDPYNQFSLYGSNVGSSYYDILGINSGTIQRGFYKVRIGNPKTGWQEDIVGNLGLDAVLFDGRISVMADWYNKQSSGLLFRLTLPDHIGDATPPNVNIGNISNKGFDLAIGSRGKFSRYSGWDLMLTYAQYDTKIKKLNDINFFDDALGLIRNQVGSPISTFFGYQIIGLFKDQADVDQSPVQDAAAPGRFKYADINGVDSLEKFTGKPDGKITYADRTVTGNPNPDFTLGLNLAVHFGQFDLSTFFYGSFGNDVYYGLKFEREISPVYNLGVYSPELLNNSWTPSNTNTTVPIAETSFNFSNKSTNHSYAVVKGSYFRNKSLIFGYTLPPEALTKLHLEKLRIYAQVTNLFTITDYPGLDPEIYKASASPQSTLITPSAFGIDFGTYPTNQKQFLIGLNLIF